MMNKLEKIEEWINGIISKMLTVFLQLFSKILHKVIPKVVFDKISSAKENSKEKSQKRLVSFKEFSIEKYKKINKNKDIFFEKINEVQNYPVKEKSIEKLSKIKTHVVTTPPKQHLKDLRTFLLMPFKLISQKFSTLNKTNLKYGVPAVLIILFGAYGVYDAVNDIYQTEFPSREPASVQEYDYRPDYRLYEQKTIQILNVKVPVFVESIGEVDSITIDFSLRLSTRFARYYLLEYEYKLKDYFFTGVEPVISDFPMQEEGKEVLKEKIRDEINDFLQDNDVEGFVEEVNILYMVGS